MPNKPNFKVIIAGGRDFDSYKLLCEKCDKYLNNKKETHNIIIVSGTAKGADKLGERYANDRGYPIVRYPANWDKHGRSAGYKRNAKMADNAHALIAFWDEESKGTGHMINLAIDRGLKIKVVSYAYTCQECLKEVDALYDFADNRYLCVECTRKILKKGER